jgi:ABC-type multidrug transport system fused ATPase/permease subunit
LNGAAADPDLRASPVPQAGRVAPGPAPQQAADAAGSLMPTSLYGFIWRESANGQIRLCLLTLVVVPLSTLPLELQRRIVDDALGSQNVRYLLMLAAAYLAAILLQGGLKYILNVYRGRVVEIVIRRLRQTIYEASLYLSAQADATPDEEVDKGGLVSMVAAEAEEVGGFVGDSISIPLLQGGTVLVVFLYLLWVQPVIASLAVIIYFPQVFVVRQGQGLINRFARTHAKLLRKMGDHIVVVGPAAKPGVDPIRRFLRLANRAFDTRIVIYRTKFFLTFFGNFLDALGPLIVLLVGGWLVIHGRTEVSTLVVFISGFQKVADPWDQLINFYRSAANADIKYRLIVDTLMPRKREPVLAGPA